jgi:UDP-glucose 4-epimerase
VIVRLFNTVGPRQTASYGMVIPRFVTQALGNDPITVHGTGEQRRSFLHVQDAVDAVMALMERPEAHGQAFNIGEEREISILALARLVRDRLDSSSRIVTVPYEEVYGEGFEDLERRRPETSKLRNLLDWRPSRTLDDIVDDVAAERRTRVG